MQSQRPINLNLLMFRFPITAIISIIHRISGILLFLSIPLILYALQQSLLSNVAFAELQSQLDSVVFKLIFWVILSALTYHLFAGVRHLLMDAGVGETLRGGRLSAKMVAILSGLSVIGWGIWLW